MKFEGSNFNPPDIEGLKGFWDHYKFVVKFLLDFNQDRLSLDKDIQSASVTQAIPHNTKFTISHGNKQELQRVNYSGRIEMLRVISSKTGSMECIAKLLTTELVTPLRFTLTTDLKVVDPTFFVKGDSIKIGTYTRKIENIYGNMITLDASVLSPDTYVISLATDTVKFTCF